MSNFIPVMLRRRLERVAAAVEGEPLADQAEHDVALTRRARAGVWRRTIRRAGRRWRRGHGQERAHAAALAIRLSSSTSTRSVRCAAGDRAGALGELLRPEQVGRRVLQVAGAVDGVAATAPGAARARRALAARAASAAVGRLGRSARLRRAVAVEPVLAEHARPRPAQRAATAASTGSPSSTNASVRPRTPSPAARPQRRRRFDRLGVGGRAPAEADHGHAARAHALTGACARTVTWPRAPRISPRVTSRPMRAAERRDRAPARRPPSDRACATAPPACRRWPCRRCRGGGDLHGPRCGREREPGKGILRPSWDP